MTEARSSADSVATDLQKKLVLGPDWSKSKKDSTKLMPRSAESGRTSDAPSKAIRTVIQCKAKPTTTQTAETIIQLHKVNKSTPTIHFNSRKEKQNQSINQHLHQHKGPITPSHNNTLAIFAFQPSRDLVRTNSPTCRTTPVEVDDEHASVLGVQLCDEIVPVGCCI